MEQTAEQGARRPRRGRRAQLLMNHLLIYGAAALLCATGWGQETATENSNRTALKDEVVMTAGQRQISVAELCAAIRTLPPPQATGFPQHPALAAQWYGPLVALAEEAKREHLGQQYLQGDISPVDQANALSAELIRKIASDSEPTEDEIKQYYAAHPDEFERTRARHIVISDATALATRSNRTASEAQIKAEQIAAQLKQGADFATLAARESDDPYSRGSGGALGDIAHHQMEPAIDEVLWSLPVGQTSAPFAGRFGYEIVRVESRRILPLSEAREDIIGNIKFLRTTRERQKIISATPISLKRSYMDSQLPCELNAVALGK